MGKNYLNFLEKEFISANIKDKERIEKLDSESYIKELSDWILEQQKIGKLYLDLLFEMSLNHYSDSCVELFKSDYDTIVKKLKTKIKPSDDSKIEGIEEDRIIKGQIIIGEKGPLLLLYNNSIRIPVSYISTYMAQNTPLSLVNGFKTLHNTQFCDIILGVYGNSSDTDKEYKLKKLKEFRNDLRNEGLKEEYVTINDKYMYVVASDNVKKLRK